VAHPVPGLGDSEHRRTRRGILRVLTEVNQAQFRFPTGTVGGEELGCSGDDDATLVAGAGGGVRHDLRGGRRRWLDEHGEDLNAVLAAQQGARGGQLQALEGYLDLTAMASTARRASPIPRLVRSRTSLTAASSRRCSTRATTSW